MVNLRWVGADAIAVSFGQLNSRLITFKPPAHLSYMHLDRAKLENLADYAASRLSRYPAIVHQ
jgi:hypothetical protein